MRIVRLPVLSTPPRILVASSAQLSLLCTSIQLTFPTYGPAISLGRISLLLELATPSHMLLTLAY